MINSKEKYYYLAACNFLSVQESPFSFYETQKSISLSTATHILSLFEDT